jgi:hypothetical protein
MNSQESRSICRRQASGRPYIAIEKDERRSFAGAFAGDAKPSTSVVAMTRPCGESSSRICARGSVRLRGHREECGVTGAVRGMASVASWLRRAADDLWGA